VQLHKPDIALLEKAGALGQMLIELRQEEGQPLVDAVNAILGVPEESKPWRDGKKSVAP